MASTSACAVGSGSSMTRLRPRDMIFPSLTTTAPTGTSLPSKASRARSSASLMNTESSFRSSALTVTAALCSGIRRSLRGTVLPVRKSLKVRAVVTVLSVLPSFLRNTSSCTRYSPSSVLNLLTGGFVLLSGMLLLVCLNAANYRLPADKASFKTKKPGGAEPRRTCSAKKTAGSELLPDLLC